MAARREDNDESYVVDLCDNVLGMKAERNYNKFPWLVGDTGRRLPVDAYYPARRLVVEYHETQHTRPAPFFDRRMTASGCTRGEQRRRYDERRRVELPKHGITLVEIDWSLFGPHKRLKRNKYAHLRKARDELQKSGFA